jgi:hypothetical protein
MNEHLDNDDLIFQRAAKRMTKYILGGGFVALASFGYVATHDADPRNTVFTVTLGDSDDGDPATKEDQLFAIDNSELIAGLTGAAAGGIAAVGLIYVLEARNLDRKSSRDHEEQ